MRVEASQENERTFDELMLDACCLFLDIPTMSCQCVCLYVIKNQIANRKAPEPMSRAIYNSTRAVRVVLSSLDRKALATTGAHSLLSENIILTTKATRLHSTQASDDDPLSSSAGIPINLLHKKASTRRTFAPNSNAQAMLVCGGEALAAHASWDPQYSRARKYIRNHAVGPAVLSPVLIQGLVGALVEANLSQSFFVENRLRQLRPLIVGVEVEAEFEVISVVPSGMNNARKGDIKKTIDTSQILKAMHGYELELETRVKRTSDGAVIAEGQQTVWLPEYASHVL